MRVIGVECKRSHSDTALPVYSCRICSRTITWSTCRRITNRIHAARSRRIIVTVGKGIPSPASACRVRGDTSPYPSPLRTARDSFPSSSSSLQPLLNITHLVQVLMTRLMQMYQVLCSICATISHRYLMMGMQFFSINRCSPQAGHCHCWFSAT